MTKSAFRVALLGATLLLGACVSKIPIEEYTLARSAVDAAKVSQAPRYASGLWHEAEAAYRKAENAYKARDYGEAEKNFLKAKLFAERAENAARFERQKNGDFE